MPLPRWFTLRNLDVSLVLAGVVAIAAAPYQSGWSGGYQRIDLPTSWVIEDANGHLYVDHNPATRDGVVGRYSGYVKLSDRDPFIVPLVLQQRRTLVGHVTTEPGTNRTRAEVRRTAARHLHGTPGFSGLDLVNGDSVIDLNPPGVTLLLALLWFIIGSAIAIRWHIRTDLRGWRGRRRIRAGRCPRCNYPTEGLTTCPECGTPVLQIPDA